MSRRQRVRARGGPTGGVAVADAGGVHAEAGRGWGLVALQRVVGNRAVARLVGGRERTLGGAGGGRLVNRAPGDPAAPPRRPKVRGTRAPEERHIKDMSFDRKPPTFAQIYLAVRDGQFSTVFDGDLKRLDLSELQTLDSVAARQTEYYAALARQQESDPDFEPPEGVPDLVFKNVVREFRSFREGRLAPALERSARREMAPALIDPWVDFIVKNYGGQPIGEALLRSVGAARVVVEAELAGREYAFTDEGALKWGYLDPAGVGAVRAKPLEKGATKEEAAAQMEVDIVKAIHANRSILPLKLANAFLTSGSGAVEDTANLVTRIAGWDYEIAGPETVAEVQQKRVGTALFIEKGPPPQENLIFDWMVERSNAANTVYGAYAEYIQAGE